MWEYLPDVLLEDIYSMLSLRERYMCSMVCKSWYEAFYFPEPWRRLFVRENTFIRRKYTYLKTKGYGFCKETREELSPRRVQQYFFYFGHLLKNLYMIKLTDFNIMYEFMNILAYYIKQSENYPLDMLESFTFVFQCEQIDLWSRDKVVYGTGGKLLERLIVLLSKLKHLHRLTINNLLLSANDAPGLLSMVLESSPSLTHLEILNCTKERYPLFEAAMFHNLQTLAITQLQLTDDLVLMLAKLETLREIVLVHDKFSGEVDSLSPNTWHVVKHISPKLRVRLEMNGNISKEVCVQDNAPVYSIVYKTPYSLVNPEIVVQIAEEYKSTLEEFGHLYLPRKYGPHSFHERADSYLALLVRECRLLHTLVIRERVSTATLLVIAEESARLCDFYVRKNAVIIRCDWPKASHWTDEFYKRLQQNSRSYDLVEAEISEIFGYKWKMYSDAAFKKLDL